MFKKQIRKIANNFGYDIVRYSKAKDKEYGEFIELYNECKEYTMTSIERMFALYKATEYVIKNDLKGDFIECGVWRGGSSMLIAKTLKKFKVTDRKILLFDTYEGMNEPTKEDKNVEGSSALNLLQNSKIEVANSVWCYASLEEVKHNMLSTGYPIENITFVKGKVEDTLVDFNKCEALALLRLDTDWYESTKMEMEVLYPLLIKNGILIIDDYGYWEGSRKAIDEYFEQQNIITLLNRIDNSGRIVMKTH